MVKTLRITLVALLALVANISFAQKVTLDFTSNDGWNFPTSATKDEGSFTKDGYTVVLKGGTVKDDGYKFSTYDNNTSLLLFGKTGATLTLPKFDFAVSKIVIEGGPKASTAVLQNFYVGETAVSTQTKGAQGTLTYNIAADYQAAGNVYVLKVISSHNTQVSKIKVYEVGSTDPDPEPDQPDVPTVQTVDNIKAFKALASGTTAALKLNNATVVYKNEYTTKSGTNTELYVSDATGAIQFFNTGLAFEKGDVLNGTVEGKFTVYNGMPELAKTANTSAQGITADKATAVSPRSVTVADLTDDTYLCEYVTVKGNLELVSEGGHDNIYISSDDESVMVYDKFKTGVTIPTDGNEYVVTGILISAKLSGNIVYELAPLSIASATGINGINADTAVKSNAAYNLAGQRVSKDYKGIVIVNGKKTIQ